MKIYDISKELFSASVYPGDPKPERTVFTSLEAGDHSNVSILTLGSHNGTHMDAPKHFVAGAKSIDQMDLGKCLGSCRVARAAGKLTPEWVAEALSGGVKRLLIAGDIEITIEAARKMTELGLWFLGVESMTVGPLGGETGPIHRELLSHEVAVLEACVLTEVPEGEYFLVCQPLKMAGLDGSPARPLLLDGVRAD